MENKSYFASDGSYGNGNDGEIIIINTADWLYDMWQVIDNCADDNERMLMAQHFDQSKHTFDQIGNHIFCGYCGLKKEELGM